MSTSMDTAGIGIDVAKESTAIRAVRHELEKVIVGQSELIDRLLIGLLCNAHLLIEGVPGLAKTLAVTTLARALDVAFRRIQFTPDMLPADMGRCLHSGRTACHCEHEKLAIANTFQKGENGRTRPYGLIKCPR